MRQILLFLFLVNYLQASTTISGRILSDGTAAIGANVFIEGSYDGATSDTLGNFSFTTSEEGAQHLVVLLMGYDTFRQKVIIDGRLLNFTITLRENRKALSEVVVTAGSFEATTDRRRAAVLSPIDIALTASASADIAGAITMLPGTTRNGESGQILVRGGSATETRTFMDGMLIQNPYNSTVANLPARNRFSPFLFKGVMFSTGGYSAEYGQAMSSALLLQTEDLAPKTGTGIMLLSVGGGLSHTRRWEKTSLSVSGSYNNMKPYFTLAPQRQDWIKAPQSGEGQLVFRRQTSERGGMLKAYLHYNRSLMSLNTPVELFGNQFVPLQLKADNVYVNVSLREELGRRWTFFSGLAYTHNKDAVSSAFQQATALESAQWRFSLSRPIGHSLRLKFGGEYMHSHYRQSSHFQDTATGLTQLRDNYGAIFAETDLSLSRKWVARTGVRMEYAQKTGRYNAAPRVSLAYLLGKKEQISLAFGQFHQTPGFEQLQYGNKLNFEQATHALLNYQLLRNGYVFRVELYQKWYNKLLKNEPLNGLPYNGGQGYARGLDVFLRDNKHIKNGDYWISYSYLDTRRDWKQYPRAAMPEFAMKHSFSIAYKQFFPKINTAFSASYAFNSGRPYYDPNLDASRFLTSRTPVYQDVSMTCTYLTNVRGHFTVLYFSLQNVLGMKQVFGYQYASTPDSAGLFARQPVQPPAKRFGVVALIISIGQKYEKEKVSSDDY